MRVRIAEAAGGGALFAYNMLAIKLKLAGKKHQRMFRVVVAEKKSKLQGRYVDDLGFWNPHTNKFSLNEEKTNKWLKEGVRPTDTAHNLLVKAGIIKGAKISVHKKSKKPQETEVAAAVVSATEQVVEEVTVNGAEEKHSGDEVISGPITEEVVVNTLEERPVSEEVVSESATEENNEEAKQEN